MTLCLDASILIKLLTREPDSDKVHALFGGWLENSENLIAPAFCLYELYAVLRKKNHLGLLTDDQTQTCLTDLKELPVTFLPDQELLGEAFLWSKRLKQAVIYDCLYLALAHQENALFWTADRKFYEAAKGEFTNVEVI